MAQIIRGSRIILKENPVALIMLLMLSCLCGCNHSIRNNTLKGIQTSLDDLSLTEAKGSEIYHKLSDMNADSLNEGERRLLAFLKIKAADKAYMHHNNDTAYLKVKDYFRHHNTDLYPEVLYYGGRVYSDMGDYPTALQYFHEALERVGNSENQLWLRGTIHSQTGRLLDKICVYNQALTHVDESIRIDSLLKDTTGMIYDLQLAGGICIRAKEYDKAKAYITQAQQFSEKKYERHSAINKMYLARIAYKGGKLAEARHYIHETLISEETLIRNEAYVIATEIYLEAGIRDSAYFLAKKVVKGNDLLNKHIGYHFLLNDKLSDRISTDSLRIYIKDYYSILENTYKVNENNATLMQLSLYNYKVHDRKRIKAEQQKQFLIYCIIGGTLTATILIIILLWSKYRQQRTINDLRTQLENIRILKKRIYIPNTDTDKESVDENDACPTSGNDSQTKNFLRDRLRKELLQIYESKGGDDGIKVNDSILVSTTYKDLIKKIENNKEIKEDSSFWDELEKVILKASPDFIANLHLLMGGKLTTTELHTAFLIKCGIKPAQMSIIFGRSKSAIVSRRDTLSMKGFDRKLGTKMIDGLIRLL